MFDKIKKKTKQTITTVTFFNDEWANETFVDMLEMKVKKRR